MCTPSPPPPLSVGELERTSTLRGGLPEKRGVIFLGGGGEGGGRIATFEIFNDKKSLKTNIFFSAITKNSNWKILTENFSYF